MNPRRFLRQLWFYAVLEVLRPMPLRRAARCLSVMTAIQYWIQPMRRRRTAAWLKAIGAANGSPSETRRLVQAQLRYEAFRWWLRDLLLLHDPRDYQEIFRVEGWERIDQALTKGRGVVMISTHAGLGRLLRWRLRATHYQTFHLLRLGHPDQSNVTWFYRLKRWNRMRYKLEAENLIGQGDHTVALKRAYDRLRQNCIVHIVVDGPRGQRQVPITFCGQRRTIGGGGFALSLLSGAEILPCFTVVEDGPRFLLEIQEPLTPAEASTDGEPVEPLQALAAAYARRLEAYVLRYPTNVTPRPFVGSR